MRVHLGWVVVAVLVLRPGMAWAQTTVPPSVQAALEWAQIMPADYGLWVAPVGDLLPVLAHNSERLFNPASTMKLLTTHAALARWGPNYRWTTTLLMRGRLQEDTLWGDLIVRGGGDPKLVIEDLEAIVAQLRALGLRTIKGQLVLDDSLYATDRLASDAWDGAPTEPYNVYPNAALMNFKAVRLIVQPRPKGAQVTLDPPLRGVPIRNQIRLVKETRCRAGVAALAVSAVGSNQRPEIQVAGRYSVGCGEQSNSVSVLDHRQFSGALFRTAWERAGGRWQGEAVMASVPDAQATVLLRWTSPRALGEVVRDINKFSNNVMARQVFWHMGLDEHKPGPVPLTRARQTVGAWLERRGLWARGTVVDNGSGLSRDERITPVGLGRILEDAARSPHGAAFMESLPVVGVDGTMRRRLREDPVAGHAHIKTGSLSDVRSIAGYVQAASGRRFVVVMLINSPRAGASAPAQDALLRWVYRL